MCCVFLTVVCLSHSKHHSVISKFFPNLFGLLCPSPPRYFLINLTSSWWFSLLDFSRIWMQNDWIFSDQWSYVSFYNFYLNIPCRAHNLFDLITTQLFFCYPLSNFTTFVSRMALGYAYPAYECYKIVEKNKPEIEDLRFWCQYWWVFVICFFTLWNSKSLVKIGILTAAHIVWKFQDFNCPTDNFWKIRWW